SHRQKVFDDETLFDLLRRRCREVVFWPDRPATNLLAARELDVGVAHDRRDLVLVLHEEDGVHLDVFAGALQADDGRDVRAKRGRDRLDPRIGRERVLDVLRVYVRAVGENDHVLLAAAQPEESILVELAEIPGVVPAVLVEDRTRRFLVLPVALEDVRTARDDLAVGGHPDLDAGQRRADRTETIHVDAVEGEGGRALGGPVSLEDVDPELAPRLAESRVERGASRNDVPEPSSKLAVNAEKDHTTERHRQAARDPAQPLEKGLLPLRLGASFDRQHQRLHDRGRDQHHRNLAFLEGAPHYGGLAAGRIDHRRA